MLWLQRIIVSLVQLCFCPSIKLFTTVVHVSFHLGICYFHQKLMSYNQWFGEKLEGEGSLCLNMFKFYQLYSQIKKKINKLELTLKLITSLMLDLFSEWKISFHSENQNSFLSSVVVDICSCKFSSIFIYCNSLCKFLKIQVSCYYYIIATDIFIHQYKFYFSKIEYYRIWWHIRRISFY